MNITLTQLRTLPLSKFDEQSWLKPPMLLFLNLALLAKGALLFVAALASRETGAKVLSAMYPEQQSLYIALILSAVPFVTIVLLTVGNNSDYPKIKRGLFAVCALLWVGQVGQLAFALFHIYKPFGSVNFTLLMLHVIAIATLFSSLYCRAYLLQTIKADKLIPDTEKPAQEEQVP